MAACGVADLVGATATVFGAVGACFALRAVTGPVIVAVCGDLGAGSIAASRCTVFDELFGFVAGVEPVELFAYTAFVGL